jgi:hypothetical protein
VACIAALVCVFVLVRRRRDGRSVAAPVAVIGLGIMRGVMLGIVILGLIATFKSLASVPADQKQAKLSEGINAAMTPTQAFPPLLDLPLLVGAWLLDRWLLGRAKRVHQATKAPTGSLCAVHPSATAALVCGRCGAFMCTACQRGEICVACAGR